MTARGWEDLSELLKSYEELQVEVSEEIVGEFLQKEEITRDFAAYYRLYERYKTDYRVGEILEGTVPQKEYRLICEMAARAQFEERFTLTQLVMEALDQQAAAFEKVDVRTVMLHQNLIQLKRFFQEQTCVDSMKEFLAERRKHWMRNGRQSFCRSGRDARRKSRSGFWKSIFFRSARLM